MIENRTFDEMNLRDSASLTRTLSKEDIDLHEHDAWYRHPLNLASTFAPMHAVTHTKLLARNPRSVKP